MLVSYHDQETSGVKGLLDILLAIPKAVMNAISPLDPTPKDQKGSTSTTTNSQSVNNSDSSSKSSPTKSGTPQDGSSQDAHIGGQEHFVSERVCFKVKGYDKTIDKPFCFQ